MNLRSLSTVSLFFSSLNSFPNRYCTHTTETSLPKPPRAYTFRSPWSALRPVANGPADGRSSKGLPGHSVPVPHSRSLLPSALPFRLLWSPTSSPLCLYKGEGCWGLGFWGFFSAVLVILMFHGLGCGTEAIKCMPPTLTLPPNLRPLPMQTE